MVIKMYDVSVIGGGVIGGLTARKLARYKLKICVIEKENDVAMGASKANSAIVHAGFDAAPLTLKAKLNVKGSEMMERIASELGVKYRRNGSLVVAFDDKDRDTVTELYERGIKNGVRELRIIERGEVLSLEPNISDDVVCALYAPTGAIVCPYELTVAAIGNAMDNGAKLYTNFEVSDINKTGEGYEIISSNGDVIKSAYVVNAAGINADSIAAMAGCDDINIRPRRGEYILLDKADGGVVSHTIFQTPSDMGKGILVTPTVDGNLLLGPTAEDTDDKTDKRTTPNGLSKVLDRARKTTDRIDPKHTITSFCGLRAVGNTGDFIIKSNGTGFINAAGIESPGLSAAPAIAEYIVELLKNDGLELEEKSDFNPVREPTHAFREASAEAKNKIIAEKSEYGRIICRCEGISEGEIRAAIRQNPPARDLDAVKRRTRAQMGRCQGGFCMPYITGIIAEELGIPYEEVTKSGKGSEINIGKTKEI